MGGGLCGFVGARGTWELSVLSAQYFLEPKTALQNKAYLNKQKSLLLWFSFLAKKILYAWRKLRK